MLLYCAIQCKRNTELSISFFALVAEDAARRITLSEGQKWDHAVENAIRKATLGMMVGTCFNVVFFRMFCAPPLTRIPRGKISPTAWGKIRLGSLVHRGLVVGVYPTPKFFSLNISY